MDRSAIDRNGIQTRDAKAGDGYAGSSQPSPRNREDDNVHPSSEARTNVKQPCEMHSAGEQAASGQTGAAVSSEVAMSSKCPSTVHESGASTSRVSVESKVAAGSRADRAQEGNKEEVKSIVGDWTAEQLKALHDHINKRGTEDSALAYGAARVPGRSAVEIQELVEAIREAIRNEKRNHVVAQTRAWINKPVGPMPSTSSEINSWSQAVQAVQTRKRKVQDCTRQAMARLLWHEVSCRPASETTRRLLPVTDSDKHPGSAVHEVVDFCRLYRFLHSCVSQGTIRELKSLEAAILLSILNEIQEEVDSPEHENKRRVLAGIFRDIQEGKLSDYDFHCVEGWDNIRSVQLDPLNLFSRTRNIFEDDSAANDDPSAHSRQ